MQLNRSLAGFATRLALLGSCWCSAAHAVEPAGGPAEPLESLAEEPDASVTDKSWLLDGAESTASAASPKSIAGPNIGTTAAAVLLLAALGGVALWLRRRKAALGQMPDSEARLNVLASSRVGPKAYAVTASLGGRVMLLGVTDHNVTHLAWLDPAAPPALGKGLADDARGDDDLPDDYPGSALRDAARASGIPPVDAARWGTSEANLRRFQEVLRDAAQGNAGHADDPEDRAPDAASLLAARTRDVLGDPPAAVEPRAASQRRKRVRKTSPPATTAATEPESALEGQAAGLKTLRKS
jgi:MYXO-CTERM domain-containing protein